MNRREKSTAEQAGPQERANPFDEALARGLSDDRARLVSVQRFINPAHREWRTYQRKIDAIDHRLASLGQSKRASNPIRRSRRIRGSKRARVAPRIASKSCGIMEHLRRQGLSVNDWATKAGIDASTVRDIIHGDTQSPRPSSLKKLAEGLSIPVEQLEELLRGKPA